MSCHITQSSCIVAEGILTNRNPRPPRFMLCDRIIDYLRDGAPSKPTDWVDINWFESTRRALRKSTRAGRPVGILLPVGQRIAHDAVLFDGDDLRIVVNVLPTSVFVTRPATFADMGRLALELGNLHAPVQILADTLLTLPDGPTEEVLDRLAIPFTTSTVRFEPTPLAAPVTYSTNFRIINSIS